MKLLITGGAGFFGSKLVEKFLKEGYSVTVYDNLQFGDDGIKPFLSNTNYNLIKEDITNFYELEKSILDKDIIINAAAYVGEPLCKENLDKVEQVNTMAAVKLAQLCEEKNKQYLFLSTCSNYGIKPNTLVDETSELNPSGLYSNSKINAENKIIETAKSALILRCATLFGVSHRMRVDLTINQLIYEIFRDNQITVFGENAWRPYVHVEDACNMIYLALDKKLSGVFNLGDNSLNFTKKQIVNELQKKLKFGIKFIEWNDPRDYKVDFSKLRSRIDYQIKYGLNDGIIELLDHMNTYEFQQKLNIKNNPNV